MVGRLAHGERVAAVAAGLALSTTTVRRWWRRFQAEGPAGLVDRSSRPHRSPRRLPLPTVVHVQRQLGLARLSVLDPKPPVHCYERRVPGALIHLDIKKLGRIGRVGHRIHGDRRTRVRGIGWEYLHIAIDDATRLAYAANFPDETAVSTAALLRQAAGWFARQGITWWALMTENGGGYRSHRFQAARRQLRIRQVWTRPYRPQTNGKAERFIRTCLARWAHAAAYHSSRQRATMLPEWLRYYNTEHPHTALGFSTPAQRFADRQ